MSPAFLFHCFVPSRIPPSQQDYCRTNHQVAGHSTRLAMWCSVTWLDGRGGR